MLLKKWIPFPYIFGKIRNSFISVALLAALVLYVTSHFQHYLPEMPFSIPAFIGTAISVLLSFKLNQAYDRWWEARKVWGSIVNDSRSLVIELMMFTANGNHPLIKKIALRQIAWCYSLGQALRGLDPLHGLGAFLSAGDLEEIKRQQNKPLAMLRLHGADVRQLKEEGQYDTFTLLKLDDTLVRLCDSQGRAERIKNTVFPVTYVMFLHFMIYLFMITLSISLSNVKWYFEIPLLLVICMIFFLLEESATHMQDPFENRPTDTPITSIARTIEINIKELLNESSVPAPHPASGFFIK